MNGDGKGGDCSDMKCVKCKGEWSPPQGITITECPFCKESFAPVKEPKTFGNAKEALAFIADTYGAEALLARNLFSDIAPNLSEARELMRILREKGVFDVLQGALNASQPELFAATLPACVLAA